MILVDSGSKINMHIAESDKTWFSLMAQQHMSKVTQTSRPFMLMFYIHVCYVDVLHICYCVMNNSITLEIRYHILQYHYYD